MTRRVPIRALVLLVATLLLMVGAAASATAATRYAAPGGTGEDPCARPADPCSVATAADRYAPRSTLAAGDVVELAPGTYTADSGGEFGLVGTVIPPAGVTIRGEPGKAKPVIVIEGINQTNEGAFRVARGVEVADLEIRNRVDQGATIEISGGTVDRVVARSAVEGEATCEMSTGTIRDSACLNSGGGLALGASLRASRAAKFQTVLRNSTFVATGPGSIGMHFSFGPPERFAATARVIGTIAKGEAKDIAAHGFSYEAGVAASARIELVASNYATVETKTTGLGAAFVTPPGTEGNVTAPPLLAAGNLHQLPGSPTIDAGQVDGASGGLDVEHQGRTMGAAPDIGADEYGLPPFRANSLPVTELVEQPALWSPKRSVELTFGSSEPGSRFECKLDGRPFRSCASPFQRKLRLGWHRFEVRAIDALDAPDASPPVCRWRVVPWSVYLRTLERRQGPHLRACDE